MINNKEYTVKKNLFNKRNKIILSIYRYGLVPMPLFYYTEFIILRHIAVQKGKKRIQNQNSNRVQWYQIISKYKKWIIQNEYESYKLIYITYTTRFKIKRNIKIDIQKNIGK